MGPGNLNETETCLSFVNMSQSKWFVSMDPEENMNVLEIFVVQMSNMLWSFNKEGGHN